MSNLKCQQNLVIDALRRLRKGRRAKGITTELNYFIKHRIHMAYDSLLTLKLPIGSGAIECAIRHIVNLRLKDPSLLWCKSNAEYILLLRSYYKNRRWKQFLSLALSPSFLTLFHRHFFSSDPIEYSLKLIQNR